MKKIKNRKKIEIKKRFYKLLIIKSMQLSSGLYICNDDIFTFNITS